MRSKIYAVIKGNTLWEQRFNRYVEQMVNTAGCGFQYAKGNKWLWNLDKTAKVDREELTQRLHREQNRKCLYCGEALSLAKSYRGKNKGVVLDHHHESGNIRGVAHSICNQQEGYFWGDVRRGLRVHNRVLMRELGALG